MRKVRGYLGVRMSANAVRKSAHATMLDRNLLDDLDAVSIQADYFARMIGQQAYGAQS